jgi:hypothetical protein
MKSYSQWIWISFFGMLVLGCAAQAPQGPIIKPAERLEFDGFSVLPPQGRNWYLGKSPAYGVVFNKRLFDKPWSPEMHSFYVAVVRHDLSGKELNTPQDLLSFVEGTFRVAPRFHIASSNVVLDDAMSKVMDTDCVRYDVAQEEHDNPMMPEAVLIMTVHGFECRHPSSPKIAIGAWCSERYPQGEQSLMNKTLERECESFLRNVLLKPPGRQIATHIIPIPQGWVPAQWERMILAAKQARERGDKIEAERLCAQALPYVNASTVKSLYEYAEFLREQKRAGGADVLAKADKMRQSHIQQAKSTQPGNTYLGFVPWNELKEYADLLQELHRGAEAEAMRALSDAYKHAQEAYIRRTLLYNQGSDPRGEC